MPTYEGRLDATGLRIALLASRFNETITKSLLDGALSALRRHGQRQGRLQNHVRDPAFEAGRHWRGLANPAEAGSHFGCSHRANR